MQNFFILGLDGLEYNFVEKWNLKNLQQLQYGTIEVPIGEGDNVPTSPEVWASFLTGKHISNLRFVKPFPVGAALDFLKFIRKHINISLGLGRKVGGLAPSRFPRLKHKTFLDHSSFKEINVPYYSYDHRPINVTHRFTKGELSLSEAIDTLLTIYEERKKQILDETERLRDVKVVFAYMHYPDILQHLFIRRLHKIKEHYVDLDGYVSILKRKADSLFLIVSDHGFDLKKETHSKYGFYSSNKVLNPKPKQITDFFKIVTGGATG